MTELKDIDSIAELINRYEITTMVETGCYKGDGIQAAFDLGIKRVISCDINSEYIQHCSRRFFGKNLTLNFGPSEECMADMCRLAGQSSTLFWLDAHLPEMYGTLGAPGRLKMPVLNELHTISVFKSIVANDIIIVDDTRIIKSDDNPRFRPGETICCKPVEDIKMLDIVQAFEKTHFAKHYMDHEGYVMFKPRLHDD